MKKRKAIKTLTVMFLLAAAIVVQAHPQDKQRPTVEYGKQKAAAGELIVGFKKGISSSRKSSIHGSVNAQVKKRFTFVNADLVKLPKGKKLKEAIIEYTKKESVAYAEPNYLVSISRPTFPPIMPNDPAFDDLWGLHNTGQSGGTPDADIDAPEAWDITTGSDSVIVAVIDTGIDYNHEDLADNMWVNEAELNGTPDEDDDGNGWVDDIYGYDFCTSGQARDSDPMDDHSHGTHCAGTIGARGENGIGVVGVNHIVKIMALKFLSAGGSGYTSDAVECFDYARQMGAHVLSNSWGGGGYNQSLIDAIEAFDGVVVFAAGNSGTNTDIYPHYPSSYNSTNIISVTSTNQSDEHLYNYGPTTVDIGAPGYEIYSTIPGNSYGYKSGTSMATPHVAGVAALIKAQYPTATTNEIIQYIYAGAEPIDSLTGKCTTGSRLNANNALIAPTLGRGSLRVDIEPAGAVAAGAQWRRGGTSTWFDSGVTENDIIAGTWKVEFKEVNDYCLPSNVMVNINPGETATATGNYYDIWPGPDSHGYTGSSSTGGFEDISSSGTEIPFLDRDDGIMGIPIGFNFEFYGRTFAAVYPSVNGAVDFTDWYVSWDNTELLSSSAPYDVIAIFWDDLRLYTDGFVKYEVKGTAPYRRLIIQWRAYLYDYPFSGTVEFQMKLYETTGKIEFCYSDVYFGIPENDEGKSATIGMQKELGSAGLQYSYNGYRLLADGQKISFDLPIQTGDLQVFIEPAAAIGSGAQWRRAGTSTWLNSGDTETGIPIGSYTIEYKEITGWDTAPDEAVAVLAGQKATTTGNYNQTGSLQVTIEPQGAVDAGAKWRRTGTSTWRDSGYTEEGVSVGDVIVEYTDIPNWYKPSNETVTINFHETATATGTYVQQTGSLTVNISPQGAVDAGAKWRRTGTVTWFDSGATDNGIPIGEITVEFKTTPGWTKPSNQAATINDSQTTTVDAAYTENPLTVTASNGSGMPGDTVPINVSLNEGAGVTAFGFDLTFDPAVLEYIGPATRGGLVPAGFTFDSNLIGNNLVRIGSYSGDGQTTLNTGAGALALINFKIKETATFGTTTDLTLSNFSDDIAGAIADNGLIEVLDCVDNYDVNMDGSVTPGDALLAFQHYLGINEITDPCSLLRADANDDGNITPGDALIIFREYLGLN